MLAVECSKDSHCRDLILEDRDILLELGYKEIFFVVFKCFDLVNRGKPRSKSGKNVVKVGKNWLKLVNLVVFGSKPRLARFSEVLDKKS